MVRYRFPLSGKIKKVDADGKTFVALIDDSVQYGLAMTVDVKSQEDALRCVSINDGEIKIADSKPSIYILHVSLDGFETGDISGNSLVGVFSAESSQSMEQLLEDCFISAENSSSNKVFKMAMTMLMNTSDIAAVLRGMNMAFSADNDAENVDLHKVMDQMDLLLLNHAEMDFHWGFNNWGTNPFSGLVGMSDPGYDLRTSFSSYQLSINYYKPIASHIALGIGVGYESDVYKFNQNYVDYQNGAFTAIDTMMPGGYYSTRYVARYVQLSIHIGWYAKRLSKSSAFHNFSVRLSAIPALGWCGTHTGLKHEFHTTGKNPQDQTNLNDYFNPIKCDIRLDVSFGGFGFFFQVATMPVFLQGVNSPTKIYPIKIGFDI